MTAYLRNAMLVPEDTTNDRQAVYQYAYNPNLRWAGYTDGTNINGSVGNLVAYPSPIPHVLDATLRPQRYQLTSDDVMLALQQQAQDNITKILNSAPRSTGTAQARTAGSSTPPAPAEGVAYPPINDALAASSVATSELGAEGRPITLSEAAAPAVTPPTTSPRISLIPLEEAASMANDAEQAADLVGVSLSDLPTETTSVMDAPVYYPASGSAAPVQLPATSLQGQWEEVEEPVFWSDPWGYVKRKLAEGAGITPVKLSQGYPTEPVPANGTIPTPQNLPDPQELSRRYGSTAGIQPNVPTRAEAARAYLNDYAALPIPQAQPAVPPALAQAMQLSMPTAQTQVSQPVISAPAQNTSTPEVVNPRSFIERYVKSDPILAQMTLQGRDLAAAVPVEQRRRLGNAILSKLAEVMSGGTPTPAAVTSVQPAGAGGFMTYFPTPSALTSPQDMVVLPAM